MADAKRRDDWGHTSSILAMLANCHKDPKADAHSPREFNPMLPKRKKKMVSIGMLRKVFCPEPGAPPEDIKALIGGGDEPASIK